MAKTFAVLSDYYYSTAQAGTDMGIGTSTSTREAPIEFIAGLVYSLARQHLPVSFRESCLRPVGTKDQKRDG